MEKGSYQKPPEKEAVLIAGYEMKFLEEKKDQIMDLIDNEFGEGLFYLDSGKNDTEKSPNYLHIDIHIINNDKNEKTGAGKFPGHPHLDRETKKQNKLKKDAVRRLRKFLRSKMKDIKDIASIKESGDYITQVELNNPKVPETDN